MRSRLCLVPASLLAVFLIAGSAFWLGGEAGKLEGSHADRIARCQTWSDLRECIEDEYPELPHADSARRVELIRRWAWTHTTKVPDGCSAMDHHAPEHGNDPVAQYHLYAQNRGGSLCGGAAHNLMLLYQGFGFRAWAVNCGTPTDHVTHVVTLVECDVAGQTVVCVQDAYFNCVLADRRTKQPVDYFDVLRRLKAGRHDEILPVESEVGDASAWPVTLVPRELAERRSLEDLGTEVFSIDPQRCKVAPLADGSLAIRSPRTLSRFREMYGQLPESNFGAWLRDPSHPPCLALLLLKPLGINGPGHSEVLRKVREILADSE